MKRTARLQAIAFALILVMLTGILPPTVFAAGNVRFDDVKPTDWFYSAVEAVCGNGLMTAGHNPAPIGELSENCVDQFVYGRSSWSLL